MLQMYGIKNCDTVRKARAYLETHHIDYQFHDFNKEAPEKAQLDSWLQQIDWQQLLNKRGLTWRRLAESEKENLHKSKAILLMLEKPTIIKRPVLLTDNNVIIGFTEDRYQSLASLKETKALTNEKSK